MEDLTSFPETEVFMDRSKSVVFCFVFLTQDVGVEWVHGLFLLPLVLGKMKLSHAKLGLFCVV